jgi:hypothetical protein
MTRLIKSFIAIACLALMSSASFAASDTLETVTKKVGKLNVMFVPACDVANYKEICRPNRIKASKTIESHLAGISTVTEFISVNDLNPAFTNADTVIPKGIIYTKRNIGTKT